MHRTTIVAVEELVYGGVCGGVGSYGGTRLCVDDDVGCFLGWVGRHRTCNVLALMGRVLVTA
jgi:hypothetical protein